MSFAAEMSQSLATLLPFIRTESFMPMFASMLKQWVPTDEVFIISYPDKNLPQVEYNEQRPDQLPSKINDFLKGAFLLDPYYLAITKDKKHGFFHLNDLAPPGFQNSEYYRIYYKYSGLTDECGYLLRLEKEQKTLINISLGRVQTSKGFNKQQLQRLADTLPLIEALMKYHWQPDPNNTITKNQTDLREPLETALEYFGTSVLTERECQVVQLILHGYSTKAISTQFSISIETVKLHRKNAYAKLKINSQGELFHLFIDSLVSAPAYKGGDPLICKEQQRI